MFFEVVEGVEARGLLQWNSTPRSGSEMTCCSLLVGTVATTRATKCESSTVTYLNICILNRPNLS